MNSTMLRKIFPAILVAFGLVGCANNAQNGALIGAVAGCGLAKASGNSNHCLRAAAAGAAVGYWIGRQKDAQEAKLAAANINKQYANAGIQAQTKTRMETVPQDARTGQLQNVASVEVLDEIVVTMPAKQLAERAPEAQQALKQVGAYVASAQDPSAVTISAKNEDDFRYAANTIQTGYPPNTAADKARFNAAQSRGTVASVRVTKA